jgi:hypothetical protein
LNKTSVENLRVKDLKHVLQPLKRGRMLKDYVDVGFDTEFTAEPNSEDRELISLQFSLGKGATAVYYVNKREGVSSEELLEYVLKFLNENNAAPSKNIFLIAHFGIAELCKVNDFYNEYEKSVEERTIKVRPKVSEFNKAIRWEKSFGEITLHIADLYGHMKTSLEKIGASLGYEKMKIEVDGKDHAYWITHMKELSEKHKALFEEYAKRDAEIAVIAWRKIVEQYKPLNLDPHLYATYTALAVASFRRNMKTLPCKTAEEEVLLKQRGKGGEWREHVAKKLVYNDDFGVRLMAALSYWGGNNQCFVRGYLPNVEGTYYDFVSLYIIAGILQPLSNEFTQYKELKNSDIKDGAEGFAEVDFAFPSNEKYPCLPVKENYYQKLMFPLRGKSYCTLSELRQALDEDVKINGFHGYGFYADKNEIEHDLKPFLINMLQKKSAFDETAEGRRSIEREIEKNKMVGVVGRLAYMTADRTAEDITRLLHESSLKLTEFREYGKKKALRTLTERSEVGSTWHIEWASLILGKARSMAAWAIKQGEKCLSISTDGGFWLGNPHFENTELHKKLVAYHSGIRFEGNFDELFIARNRFYIAWNKGEVLHAARMAVSISEDLFEHVIKLSLKAERPIINMAVRKRLTGLNDYFYEGTALNSAQKKVIGVSWLQDYKRKLLSDVNIFKNWTDTAPYENVEEAFKQAYGVKGVGRPKTLSEDIIKKIREEKDKSVRQLAEEYRTTKNVIQRILSGNCSI